jgi:hypothetical protein
MLTTSRTLFGGAAPTAIAALLEQAMQSYAETENAERLLWQAHREAPDALPVYFSLYKFYFYKGNLEQAELAARMALIAAARLGQFNADWRDLRPDSADWADYEAPSHFYLFSLKALAFIRLRRADTEGSSAILAKLEELDPVDSVGASVIRSVAANSYPAAWGKDEADS